MVEERVVDSEGDEGWWRKKIGEKSFRSGR
jgi:hypothetical protein